MSKKHASINQIGLAVIEWQHRQWLQIKLTSNGNRLVDKKSHPQPNVEIKSLEVEKEDAANGELFLLNYQQLTATVEIEFIQ